MPVRSPAAPPPAAEAWPATLVLDELWLCSRRRLVQALEGRGLWTSDDAHRQAIGAERAIGEGLRDGVLRESLGDGDWGLLVRGAVFEDVPRLPARLPAVLAFGALFAQGPPGPSGPGGTCALFNLGISLFDLMVDSGGARRQAILETFDRAGFSRALASPAEWLEQGVVGAPAELRVLMRIVAAVLEGAAARLEPEAVRELWALLGSALSAELDSVQAPERGAEVAASKSVVPFRALSLLATGSADEVAPGLSRAYWLVDDVVDAVDDLRSSAVNHLLPPVEARGPVEHEARALLDGHLLQEVCEDAAAALARGLEELGDGSLGLRHRAYVRDWIEC